MGVIVAGSGQLTSAGLGRVDHVGPLGRLRDSAHAACGTATDTASSAATIIMRTFIMIHLLPLIRVLLVASTAQACARITIREPRETLKDTLARCCRLATATQALLSSIPIKTSASKKS